MKTRTHVIAVGGLDPGGGAGLLRDALTAAALGGRATLIGTAWTDQGPDGVHAVEPRDPEALQASLRRALAGAPDGPVAVKVGMVASGVLARAIVAALDGFAGAVVYDPVLATSSGGPLLSVASGETTWDAVGALAVRATLLTPNAHEAAALTGLPVRTGQDAVAAARVLRDRGVTAVLVKGGHLDGDATDVLIDGDEERWFPGSRLSGPSPRGTGCALATAIACERAAGLDLGEAVARARTWLRAGIATARAVGGEWHLP